MKVVNLTPHDINLMDKDFHIIEVIKSSGSARVIERKEAIGELLGVPIYETKFSGMVGLPEPEPGTIYIVSRIVVEACKATRIDLVTTSQIVRQDENGSLSSHLFAKGKIVGCHSFSKWFEINVI